MRTRTPTRTLVLAAAALLAIAPAGCRKKLTFERWETLEIGQTKSAVKSALGKPLDDRGTWMAFANQDKGIAAEACFDPKTGRLLYTQWADPLHGMLEKGARPQR